MMYSNSDCTEFHYHEEFQSKIDILLSLLIARNGLRSLSTDVYSQCFEVMTKNYEEAKIVETLSSFDHYRILEPRQDAIITIIANMIQNIYKFSNEVNFDSIS